MRKAVLAIVFIVALLAVIVLVDGFRDSCQCQYIGPCEVDETGSYRYYQCGGSCAAYSSWHYYPRCLDPNYKPRQLLS